MGSPNRDRVYRRITPSDKQLAYDFAKFHEFYSSMDQSLSLYRAEQCLRRSIKNYYPALSKTVVKETAELALRKAGKGKAIRYELRTFIKAYRILTRRPQREDAKVIGLALDYLNYAASPDDFMDKTVVKQVIKRLRKDIKENYHDVNYKSLNYFERELKPYMITSESTISRRVISDCAEIVLRKSAIRRRREYHLH